MLYDSEFSLGRGLEINKKSEVQVQAESMASASASMREGSELGNTISPMEEDKKPLKEEDMERGAREIAQRTRVEIGMGVHAKAWGP